RVEVSSTRSAWIDIRATESGTQFVAIGSENVGEVGSGLTGGALSCSQGEVQNISCTYRLLTDALAMGAEVSITRANHWGPCASCSGPQPQISLRDCALRTRARFAPCRGRGSLHFLPGGTLGQTAYY